MGTTATIRMVNNDPELGFKPLTRALLRNEQKLNAPPLAVESLSIFVQCDGYPSAVVERLVEKLGGRCLVNGITDPKRMCNGMSCLAAMAVVAMKIIPSGEQWNFLRERNGDMMCGFAYLSPGAGWPEEYVYTIGYGKESARGWEIALVVERQEDITERDGLVIHKMRCLYDGPLPSAPESAVVIGKGEMAPKRSATRLITRIVKKGNVGG